MLYVANCTRALALAVVPMILVSCGGGGGPKDPNLKKTFPVHGQVYLDGQPGHGVTVILVPKGSQDPSASGSTGKVGEDGTFRIDTFGADGAPAGEYVLIFTYLDPKAPLMISFDEPRPPDDFNGKYADPQASKHPLTVPDGAEDVDAGRIDLKK